MANLVNTANRAAGTSTVFVPLASQQVRVEKRKYPAFLRRAYVAHPLGTDHWGEWLGVPADGSVLLLPYGEWWAAWFRWDGSLRVDIAADVATGRSGPGTALRSFVDLDLDVERDADGTTVILDEDQFADRCGAYPPAWVATAREAVADVADQVRRGVEPFGQAHSTWVQLWQSARPAEPHPPGELQTIPITAVTR